MWNWDQGRMSYFQYDEIRTVARFVADHDFRNTPPLVVRSATGLPFLPDGYTPWRNYARVYKLCLLVSEINGIAIPTDVARVLAADGAVTCDEYLHFLAEATTDPSPALIQWNSTARIRRPLLFSLKYILTNVAMKISNTVNINEIIGVYVSSSFDGTEDDSQFIGLMANRSTYMNVVSLHGDHRLVRQARESIKFLCQLSYLHTHNNDIIATLSSKDAHDVFQEIRPIAGMPLTDGDAEIQRVARYFRDGSVHDIFDYPDTVLSDESGSGFIEGSRVKRSHIIIERNSRLRDLFFRENPTATCDACGMNTSAKYPWMERILDMHHLLPLASGTRVDSRAGTLLQDLRPVCPTCHRSVHRYYELYLREQVRADFYDKEEALRTYDRARDSIVLV